MILVNGLDYLTGGLTRFNDSLTRSRLNDGFTTLPDGSTRIDGLDNLTSS